MYLLQNFQQFIDYFKITFDCHLKISRIYKLDIQFTNVYDTIVCVYSSISIKTVYNDDIAHQVTFKVLLR